MMNHNKGAFAAICGVIIIAVALCAMVLLVARCGMYAVAIEDAAAPTAPAWMIDEPERAREIETTSAVVPAVEDITSVGASGATQAPTSLPDGTCYGADQLDPETWTSLGTYRVYGYNYKSAKQCGKNIADGITASGERAVSGETCAAAGLPYGTRLYIGGYGIVTVNDRGVSGRVLDVAFDNDKDCFAMTGDYEIWIAS
jgi:3D (Asp-Asp-Asp) domain-containing protein